MLDDNLGAKGDDLEQFFDVLVAQHDAAIGPIPVFSAAMDEDFAAQWGVPRGDGFLGDSIYDPVVIVFADELCASPRSAS